MENKENKVKRAFVTPGRDITKVVADRFESMEDFASMEPDYMRAVIAMGDLQWLIQLYSEKQVESRRRPGRRGDGDGRVVQDSMELASERNVASIVNKRNGGRGPKIYKYIDQDFALSVDDAVKMRKEGEVTMKVHVPKDSEFVPLYFNTKAENVGKGCDRQSSRDMFSSSRRKYVGWMKECGCPVKSSRVSVCRVFKNKKRA